MTNANHGDLVPGAASGVHIPLRWPAFANAAARIAQSVSVGDVTGFAFQSDTKALYFLADPVPTWKLIATNIELASKLDTIIAGNGIGVSGTGTTRTLVATVDGFSMTYDGGGQLAVGALQIDGQHGNLGGGALHALAVAGGANGFLSGSDKAKLDRDSIITLGSDVTNSTTTAADITGLSFVLAANKTYEFEFNIIHQSVASGTGCQTALNGPANSQFASRSWQPGSATNLTVQRAANLFDNFSTAVAVPIVNQDWLCTISGMITTTASGTLIGRFKSSTAATVVTARAGSWAKLKLIS